MTSGVGQVRWNCSSKQSKKHNMAASFPSWRWSPMHVCWCVSLVHAVKCADTKSPKGTIHMYVGWVMSAGQPLPPLLLLHRERHHEKCHDKKKFLCYVHFWVLYCPTSFTPTGLDRWHASLLLLPGLLRSLHDTHYCCAHVMVCDLYDYR